MIPNKNQFLQLQLSEENQEEEFLSLELSSASGTALVSEANPQNQSSPLQRFVETKIHLKETEAKLESLELEALDEALTLLSHNQEHNRNNVIYEDSIAKVVIGFRQKYESSKDNTIIARLEDEIKLSEQTRLKNEAAKFNQIDAQIQELEQQIKELEEQRQKLMETPRINSLKSRYSAAIQDSAYKQPYLSVYIKK